MGHVALSGDDDVDVVAASQAVVGNGEKAVRIRREVHPDNVCLLVHHMVKEAGILVGKTVVVLLPHVGGKQVVQRGDVAPPRQCLRDFQPFSMLVEH